MLNDSEVDLEDLEARLYGQVHHGTNIDPPEPVVHQNIIPAAPVNRYYKNAQPVDIYNYQRPPFQTTTNNFHFPLYNLINNGSNYWGNGNNTPFVGLYPLQPLNNLLLLPGLAPEPNYVYRNQRRPAINKPSANPNQFPKTHRNRKRCGTKKRDKRWENFRNHHLNRNAIKSNGSNNDKRKRKNKDESMDADVILIVSSDDESKDQTPVKVESKDGKDDGEVVMDQTNDNTLKVKQLNKQENTCENNDDDDVIFVQAHNGIEIILLDGEEEEEKKKINKSNESIKEKGDATMSGPKIDSVVEIVSDDRAATPDSTINDFIEDPETPPKEVSATEYNDATFISYSEQNSRLDVSESESSYAASDLGTPLKRSIFNETAFETPSKGTFFELTLDSFENYISSKGATSSVASTPLTTKTAATMKRKSEKFAKTNANKFKSVILEKNSSDSSSESDYDDNAEQSKTELVKMKPSSNILKNSSATTITNKRKKKQTTSKHKQLKNDNVETEKDDDVEIVSPPMGDLWLGMSSGELTVAVEDKSTTEDTHSPKKRFSDYWTDDMEKFYKSSWNHEDFSVVEVQKSMSDNPQLWRIIDADRVNMNVTPRGPRCHRCKQFGHKAYNCRNKSNIPKCILCGGCGHYETRCTKKLCPACGRECNLYSNYCSRRCANLQLATCKICQTQGHLEWGCSDLWRRYHLTVKEGPLVQPRRPQLKSISERWCSGCASRGHYEHECNYYNRTHPPMQPFVYSYQDAYDSTFDGKDDTQHRRVTSFVRNQPDSWVCNIRPSSSCGSQQIPALLGQMPSVQLNFFPATNVNLSNSNVPQPNDSRLQSKSNFPILGLFSDRHFSRERLKRNLRALRDPNLNWSDLVRPAMPEMKRLRKLCQESGDRKETAKVLGRLKMFYKSLNAILMGRFKIKRGPSCLATLENWIRNGEQTENDSVRQAYNVIFRNSSQVTDEICIRFQHIESNEKDLSRRGLGVSTSSSSQPPQFA